MTSIGHPEATKTDLWQKAIGLKLDGQYSEALELLKRIAIDQPDNAEVHHQLGLIFGFTGEFERSLDELRLAADLNPTDTLTLNDYALTCTMLGLYEEAKQQFARVLEQDRENQVALRNLTYF